MLACDPEDEAEFYRTASSHGAYSRLDELQVRTTVVFGADSDDFEPDFFLDIADRISGAEVIEAGGTNHFMPMQEPRLVASILARELEEYGKDS